MNDTDVVARLAEALAKKFTSEHGARNPDWDIEQPDGPDNPYSLTREMAERVEGSPYVVSTACDGDRSIRMPSCTELAAALLPVVREIADQRAAEELDEEPCPTCQGRVWICRLGEWVSTRETVGMVCQTCGTDYGDALRGATDV